MDDHRYRLANDRQLLRKRTEQSDRRSALSTLSTGQQSREADELCSPLGGWVGDDQAAVEALAQVDPGVETEEAPQRDVTFL